MQHDSAKDEEAATTPLSNEHRGAGDHGGDGKMLCLTVYSYKREDLSYEKYREHMLTVHARLASTLMEQYG